VPQTPPTLQPTELGGALHKVENEFTQRSPTEAEIDAQLKQHVIDLLPQLGNRAWNWDMQVTLKRQVFSRLIYYYELYKKITDVQGVICEFGVQWGATLTTLMNIRGMLEPFNHARKIYGFDTFEGFSTITAEDGAPLAGYKLEPQLITNLFDRNREKRRLVKFADIPKVLIDAVTSAEDKRFFQHQGFDPLRIMKAVYVDLKEGRKEQGASTLSQQLAKNLWLDSEKRWTRKMAELLITLRLEQTLTKQQIFEDYANQIYLGHGVYGFEAGANYYFSKKAKDLTLEEAAVLAGLPKAPNAYSPINNPERAIRRRNLVTGAELAAITAPTLVIWTSDDPSGPAQAGLDMARRIPAGEFRLIEGAGHWPQWEQREEFDAAVLEFLGRKR